MKKEMMIVGMLLLLSTVTSVLAQTHSWVSTRYREDNWSTGSWYRSPVTDGHLDVRVSVESVTFTQVDFSIIYDGDLVETLSASNVMDLLGGLTLASVTTEDLGDGMKKATVVVTGSMTMGLVQSENEALFRIRFIPVTEGTMPITLWPDTWTVYPESYNTCALTIWNNGVEVPHDRKQYNDGTQLFTFTDKTDAAVMYHYDYNFGMPLGGYLEVVYDDDTVQEFHTSDHSRGITIDPAMGGYFVSQQPNAVSYRLILAGYGSWQISSWGGWAVSHSQPEGHLFIQEDAQGFPGIQASTEDITLTVEQDGIGLDFGTSVYTAAIAGDTVGILDKTFQFSYVDDDTIAIVVQGGLAADYNYNLYVYKDGVVLGRAWFAASDYFTVLFNVTDASDNPIVGADVVIPSCMFGCTYIRQETDVNGQTSFTLPGEPQWGSFYEYRVIYPGYAIVADSINVTGQMTQDVQLTPSTGVSLPDFVPMTQQWAMTDCMWQNGGDCDGTDLNFDGEVGMEDLLLLVSDWLKE